MSCPDVNDLIDLWQGRISDPEMEAHAETCAECQENLALFDALRQLSRPAEPVPEEVIQRTLAKIDQVMAEERKRSLRWNTLGSGVLGGLTVATAVAATSGGSPSSMVPIALLAGTIAGMAQLRWPGEWDLGWGHTPRPS
jgi:anti-sigma factor RsiW